MKKLEQTNEIMQRLFDPKIKAYNVYVDLSHKRQVKHVIPLSVKRMYFQSYLMQHWLEICGANLARHCMVDKLEENVLTIRTSSTLFANELFMMKKQFLQKINKILNGSFVVKDLKFHTGKVAETKKAEPKQEEAAVKLTIVKCPLCHANMTSEKQICSVCERQQRVEKHRKLVELLKAQPWLSYKDCQKFIVCDRISFTDAKESLQNYYFERVRLGFASESEEYMAVMLLSGKSIIELNDTLISNSLEFLRRKQDVFTSRV